MKIVAHQRANKERVGVKRVDAPKSFERSLVDSLVESVETILTSMETEASYR